MPLSAKPNRKKSDAERTDTAVDEREAQAVINKEGRAAEADDRASNTTCVGKDSYLDTQMSSVPSNFD